MADTGQSVVGHRYNDGKKVSRKKGVIVWRGGREGKLGMVENGIGGQARLAVVDEQGSREWSYRFGQSYSVGHEKDRWRLRRR